MVIRHPPIVWRIHKFYSPAAGQATQEERGAKQFRLDSPVKSWHYHTTTGGWDRPVPQRRRRTTLHLLLWTWDALALSMPPKCHGRNAEISKKSGHPRIYSQKWMGSMCVRCVHSMFQCVSVFQSQNKQLCTDSVSFLFVIWDMMWIHSKFTLQDTLNYNKFTILYAY